MNRKSQTQQSKKQSKGIFKRTFGTDLYVNYEKTKNSHWLHKSLYTCNGTNMGFKALGVSMLGNPEHPIKFADGIKGIKRNIPRQETLVFNKQKIVVESIGNNYKNQTVISPMEML